MISSSFICQKPFQWLSFLQEGIAEIQGLTADSPCVISIRKKQPLAGFPRFYQKSFLTAIVSPKPHDSSANATVSILEYKCSLSFYTDRRASKSLCQGWKTSGSVSVLTGNTILAIVTCKWMLSSCRQRNYFPDKGSFDHFKQWQWLLCGTFHTWHLQRGHLELRSYFY